MTRFKLSQRLQTRKAFYVYYKFEVLHKSLSYTQQLGVARTVKLPCNFLVHFKVLSRM